jgi:hypothetical protein
MARAVGHVLVCVLFLVESVWWAVLVAVEVDFTVVIAPIH